LLICILFVYSFLPAPTQLSQDQLEAEEKARSQRSRQTSLVSSRREPPPYGYRKGWIPRLLEVNEDLQFESLFEELQIPEGTSAREPAHRVLLPSPDSSPGKTRPGVRRSRWKQAEEDGAHQVIYSKYTDLVPKEVMNADDPDLQRPDEEAIKEITEKTRVALEKSVSQKVAAAMPVRAADKLAPAQYIRYSNKLIFNSVHTEDGEARERDEIRHDRRKERQHDRNLSRAAPDKRSKLQRNENRDISEVIALGVPNPRTSNEVQYDQRLFNQSKGMDSGFAGGEDEIYNVYDQAWRGGKDMAQNIYRPSKNLDKDMYGDDLEARIKTNRFVPDKEFSGSDRRQRGREGPVQFEEDPFGLDKFLEEAKQHGGSKRPSDSSRPKEHEHEGKKRRKE
ncbi:PREDICTED: SNW domain-containing protein 1, partial [Hipposideros armiger]|uniref:SNW domain-containing protein 1 n=1 Tax=Hipposideros armiger TaxID=186990 RepID=A0A8B7R434_HIPAR